MYKIKTLNKISSIGMSQFDKAKYNISDSHENPDGIIVRSASMHEMELPSNLKAIARAGAGVNNIPIDKCSEKGIIVFNTPGANANAVKELVIAAMLLSSRKIVDGINWAQTLEGADVAKDVEKGKSQFVGPEVLGKRMGIIGLGAIGVLVANTASALGMDVIGYDPFISIEAAWSLSGMVKKAKSVKEIYESCDYISLHVPMNDETKHMVNSKVLKSVKKGVRILNFSRAGLVEDDAIIKAVSDGTVGVYVTDFPTAAMLRVPNIITIPHLGASTPESEENCARMAAEELIEFIENGNIVNSVNFPNCVMERNGSVRVCVAHDNVPNMLGQISAAFASEEINIVEMMNKSRGDLAYTVVEVEDEKGIGKKIAEISGVKSVRVV